MTLSLTFKKIQELFLLLYLLIYSSHFARKKINRIDVLSIMKLSKQSIFKNICIIFSLVITTVAEQVMCKSVDKTDNKICSSE